RIVFTNWATGPSSAPCVFVAYRPPMDFARGSQDFNQIERTVTLRVTSTVGTQTPTDYPIVIRRTPFVLVHGLWDNGDTWFSFDPSGILLFNPAFSWFNFDYGLTHDEQFLANAGRLQDKLRRWRDDVANDPQLPIAMAQFDFVTHSMGGDIV